MSCTFAPALRDKRGMKKEEHVHRHIELTAVSSRDVRNKNESKRNRLDFKLELRG